jgi:hypothetical protein
MPFLRIRPYKPEYGCKKTRYHVGGRLFVGGTGEVNDVPRWYEVNEAQAAFLMTKHQKDGDILSPTVFERQETKEQVQAIDQREQIARMAKLGIAAASPTDTRSTMQAQVQDLTGRPKEGPVKLSDLAHSRSAALEGLDEPDPPRVDGEPGEGHEEIEVELEAGEGAAMSARAKELADANEARRARTPSLATVDVAPPPPDAGLPEPAELPPPPEPEK